MNRKFTCNNCGKPVADYFPSAVLAVELCNDCLKRELVELGAEVK